MLDHLQSVLSTGWRLNFWRFRNCEQCQPQSPAGGGSNFFSSKVDIKICIFMAFGGDLD